MWAFSTPSTHGDRQGRYTASCRPLYATPVTMMTPRLGNRRHIFEIQLGDLQVPQRLNSDKAQGDTQVCTLRNPHLFEINT